MRVKDLPESDRPRERLLRQGSRALSDRELLALVLGAGMPGCDAIEMAARLIDERGGLVALAQADPHTLSRLRGVGPARAARVTAAFELARRAAGVAERRRIRGSGDIAVVAAPFLRGLRHERVVVVACDGNCGVLRVVPLTEGAADRSLIPVRDVLSTVLAIGGAAFGVAHNHPSGRLEPSPADAQVTELLRDAAETVGLRFLDHVIVTETAWARVS
ncbi:RadC family protein [Actinomadura sp. BRA 177]|uniref:JAB domain-containing protein n=1 Tax=Actinomadura sp. BRA 177 TaxID=2745202 RepID=UPI001595C7A4|nr:DNA repair protein RadC [Actinomadura sp. BRA 177]NVI87845.1 DNA repair protein RadC [Actinomadura sp. BRA 177]